ncbi:XRE family transcriptional regulator [Fibrella forsythiae]|uniref:Helix-turn-helix transcriptional regulator n=1 Tax=Fibrella forsythiae TaxID=2817061 RepID=A0ABS3JM25_9BACT|nr:helix-turn-helix transcriptional regulator [Fibrella forsythiae]MBO0951048.1 helix-turn-helix transcriptional regulator [Fibrella forsythiae]
MVKRTSIRFVNTHKYQHILRKISIKSTDNPTTTAERFKILFSELGVNANEVAVKLGESNGKFYNILTGKAEPSFKTIQQLTEHYPLINADYIIRGQLPVLHKSGAVIEGGGGSARGKIELPLFEAGTGYAGQQDTYTLPVLEKSAGSYSSAVVIRLTDNSMQPRYPVGMRLLARPVPVADWDYLNSALVMVLYRSTLVVRRIKENELVLKDLLTLYADNDDSGFVTVKREDLKSIWQVVDIVGVDTMP